MLNWIVSSSLLILVVLLIRQIFKGRIRLKLQYALWLLVLLRLLIPGHIGSSNISFANAAREGQAVIEERFVEPVIQQYVPRDEQLVMTEAETVVLSTEGTMQAKPDLSLTEALEFIWIGGAFVMAMIICLSNLHFYLCLRRSRKLLGCEGRLPIYLCRWIETPCLFGVLNPAIYIADTGGETELRHVLCHEHMHYRQGDHIWSVLRSACLVTHWYNPLVWAAAIVSRRDGELACDEAVVRHLGERERAEYGRTLLRMTIRGKESVLNMGTTMKGSGKSIAQRVQFIAKRPHMKLYTMLSLLLVAAVVAGCAFTGADQEAAEPAVESTEPADQAQPAPKPEPTEEPVSSRHEEKIVSNDGSVEFFLDIEIPELSTAMPLVELEGRDVTVEDAQAVAKAVFGTTDIYERKTHRFGSVERDILTREAAEEYLEFARSMQANEEMLKAVYGERYFAMGQEIVSNVLSHYARPEYLSQLPADADRALMNWDFVADNSNPDVTTMEMNGSFEQNGLRYRFSAVNYDGLGDLISNHSVNVMVESGYLAEMGKEKAYFEHCSNTEPTREQFAAAQSEAIRILDEMEPERWRLASCEGRTYSDRYIISIGAVPVFADYAPIRQNNIYLYEQQELVEFQFGTDGALLHMRYMFPMTQTGMSAAKNCIDFEAAMKQARNYFEDGTVEQYDYWITDAKGSYHEGQSSKVYVSDVQQGWMYVSAEGERNNYTLQPVISFLGYYESFGENGEETELSRNRANTPHVLLNLNALDGSVLEYKSKYLD